MAEPRILVLYDGVCRLCIAGLGFIIRNDPAARVRFAAMQSALGQELLARHNLPRDDFKSFAVLADGAVLLRSNAVLRIARELRQPWPVLAIPVRLLPRPLRDRLYDVVARNRYRWFGKRDTCLVPTLDVAARFLDA